MAAMLLGGLRRCEVLGLRMEDLRVGERRLFIVEGKGGHQRLIPVSARFFVAVQAYLDAERPTGLGTGCGVRGVEGTAAGAAVGGARAGRDPFWCKGSSWLEPCHLP